MIFHEIYSVYFDAVTRILQAAVGGVKDIKEYVVTVTNRLKLNGDGLKLIQDGLKPGSYGRDSKSYQFFDENGVSRIAQCPDMPLTVIEKRWLKTMLYDPRIKLFGISADGLEDVEPFYLPEDIVVFDREGEGDPWNDEAYIERFRTILSAIRDEQCIHISWLSRESLTCEAVCRPERFEYSELDDRMRLWASTDQSQIKITLFRVLSCEISSEPLGLCFPAELVKPLPTPGFREREQEKRENVVYRGDELPDRLVLEISNQRNALERALFHFSHFQKQEIVSLGGECYRLVMSIDYDDREELVNRVIAFGPYLKIIEPRWLKDQIRDRLRKQMAIRLDESGSREGADV